MSCFSATSVDSEQWAVDRDALFGSLRRTGVIFSSACGGVSAFGVAGWGLWFPRSQNRDLGHPDSVHLTGWGAGPPAIGIRFVRSHRSKAGRNLPESYSAGSSQGSRTGSGIGIWSGTARTSLRIRSRSRLLPRSEAARSTFRM